MRLRRWRRLSISRFKCALTRAGMKHRRCNSCSMARGTGSLFLVWFMKRFQK